MLSGFGNQEWMTESFEESRQKALKDRTKFTDEELEILELDSDVSLGGGDSYYKSFEIKQFPYPKDTYREKLDLRINSPKIGD